VRIVTNWKTSRNCRNSSNHGALQPSVAQPVAQLTQPHTSQELCVLKARRGKAMSELKGGGMRDLMPVTAWLVDELRRVWGREQADALVRRSMQGQGSISAGNLHSVETGPDGVVREFGQVVQAADVPAVVGKGRAAWSR
jgi:hypothetical protein